MIILGVETSCDETAAAVVQKTGDRVTILSNVVASSLEIQAKYGGVVPEQAAREQLKSIIPVIQEALSQAGIACHPELVSGSKKMLKQVQHDSMDTVPNIDAIAVTKGPGLIGSLLVGVETAKTLATVWNKPLIPVNHLVGHFYANWFGSQVPTFPCLGLLVSGGHTDLVLFLSHGKYEYLGGTRDDAAGECFDKCARLLGLSYPGGPAISKLAKKGDPKVFYLPRPMINSDDFDFSFSGLKTAAANIVQSSQFMVYGQKKTEKSMNNKLPTKNLAASIEAAIVDVLVKKTISAAKKYKVEQIIVAGGVASNQTLSETLAHESQKSSLKLFIPPPKLCTDNAAMVAAAAFYNYHPVDPLILQANPSLSLSKG